ncbi:HpcH/HpaI aldolase family protein [Sulfuritalea hydrogenivorans]|uniref:HpcH/HpaI aldolase n=1 Tax=Sulfuritalea hydrogenivorans sk43H TaxID=1223802 RepID=W0SI45_9PROT|nr:aldolase/citrate lyase family protein [Sulfuritalea hydrogenivorans]BAO31129.1 HpcH/HpaI aldolase [Sulfuritalea hydrogenivorans sk43H]
MNRLKAVREIRAQLKSGGHSIGSWMQIPHPAIAEIMGQGGYDWVAVDMEHGAVAIHQLPDLFRALELGGTLPLVRLAHGQPKDCKQALDAGAGGVIVPMIESAEQLAGVRDACRWPPAGTRGVGFSRANLFGKHFDAYREEAQAPLLVAMIEHHRAVANLEGILAVDGLDAILIGPYDLSASMGLTAQFDHPEFCAVMEKIRALAEAHAVPAGLHVVAPSRDELNRRLDEGYRFLAYSIDAVMLNSVVSHGVD